MVVAASRTLRAAGCALLLAASLPATEPFDYRVGDTVASDIVAPVAFQVASAHDPAALQLAAAQKFPAIFRFNPAAADEVERDLRAAFTTVRSNFFDAMGSVYQKRRLNPQWLNSPRFQTLSATFRQQHREFPQLTSLVELWAVGKSDEDIQSAYVARLREAMKQRIRADDLAGEMLSESQVRLVSDMAAVEKETPLVALASLQPLAQVRAGFESRSGSDDAVAAKFLTAFLKPNCLAETELTRQSRAQYVGEHSAATQYEAGQLIARSGQKVDAKLLAALGQMKTAVDRLAVTSSERGGTPPVSFLYRLNPWLWVGLVLVAAGSIIAAWRLLERKKPVMLPARVAGGGAPAGIISCPSCDENIVIPTEAVENLSANTAGWQQRALAAEQRAERAHAAIRAGVLPQLADWLKHKFVRGLVSERSQLLDAQKSAAAEMAELERRLDKLHMPLQERLHAYEQRIAELEKSLAVKGEENRELLRAKIEMTRQHLQTQRARNPLEFN